MSKTLVKGIDEARRKLRDLRDNAVTERVIVSAAKKEAEPVLSAMQSNLSTTVDRAEELSSKLGVKKIPRGLGGADAPGALVGLKKKSDFTIDTSEKDEDNKALNIYWIEYGTEKRRQTSTGRSTGKFPAFSPLRDAIRSYRDGAESNFKGNIVDAVNRRIKRNRI